MRIRHAPPHPGLARHVERYWFYEGAAGELPTLWPGTGAELWVHIAGRVVLRTGEGPRPLPKAHVVCLRHTPWTLTSAEPVALAAVRFRAGSLRHFTGVPVSELADQVNDVEDLWGRAARRLVAAGGAATADLLDRTLLGLLERSRPEPDIDLAVRRIYSDPARVRIAGLAAELGVSTRSLQRRFPAVAGASPKQFQRVARFQRLLRELLLSRRRSYLDDALSAGFYDQNHVIHDFRRFTGHTPRSLLSRDVSHFYYSSPVPGRHAEALTSTRRSER